MGKLPYIPDKKLYAAVMGACSYVKDTGCFNKSTKYYAEKYDVDVDKVRKYVRIAQGNGQKAANKNNPRNYKWYAVALLNDYYFAGDEGKYASYEWTETEKQAHTAVYTLKATSLENAKRQIIGDCSVRRWFDRPHREYKIIQIIECDTEENAINTGFSLKNKYCSHL